MLILFLTQIVLHAEGYGNGSVSVCSINLVWPPLRYHELLMAEMIWRKICFCSLAHILLPN